MHLVISSLRFRAVRRDGDYGERHVARSVAHRHSNEERGRGISCGWRWKGRQNAPCCASREQGEEEHASAANVDGATLSVSAGAGLSTDSSLAATVCDVVVPSINIVVVGTDNRT